LFGQAHGGIIDGVERPKGRGPGPNTAKEQRCNVLIQIVTACI
jgi:hypothetical protein